MTRRQNKGIWICMIFCGILELVALTGAYAANHFTRTRLGMLRHMVYLNGKWEEAMPIPTIKWIALSAIILLAILAYARFSRMKTHSKAGSVAALLTLAISGWTAYYLFFNNAGVNRAYYIISFCIIIAALLQNFLFHCFLKIEKSK